MTAGRPMWQSRGVWTGIATTAALWPLLASAHNGNSAPTPETIWSAWGADPLVILGLLVGSWLYAAGMTRLWRRAPRAHPRLARQSIAFAGGTVAIILAVVSPLDGLSEALFAAHMVQHLLLLLVAAPLFVLSEPLAPLLWALPRDTRLRLVAVARRWTTIRTGWGFFNRPLVAWLIATTILWVWHLPTLYDLAVRNALVHALEHGCFLGSALLFWWVLPHRHGRRATSGGAGVLYLFAAGMQSGILGALMTFSASAWYGVHITSVVAWGLTPLEDQQLAGLIMWIPASVVYLIAAAILFVDWLKAMEPDGRVAQFEARREPGNHATANQTG